MKKRLLCVFLACLLTLSLSVLPVSAAPPSGPCGENVTWSLDQATGVLTIQGTGPMQDFSDGNYSVTTAPWSSYGKQIRSIVVESGVTSVGSYAFFAFEFSEKNDTFSNVRTITLADTVAWIGADAFSGCYQLSSLTLSSGLKSIGNRAFFGCQQLTKVDLPAGLESVGDYAFAWSPMTGVTIPASVTSIGDSAFGYSYPAEGAAIPRKGFTITGVSGSAAESYYRTLLAEYEQMKQQLGGVSSYAENFGSDGTVYFVPVPAADQDWKALYQAKVRQLQEEYSQGKRSLPSNAYGAATPYFTLQDLDFDGTPELYHTLLLHVMGGECRTETGYEEIYYIRDGTVAKGTIQSQYHLGLIPGYRKGDPGDFTYERWQFVTYSEKEGSVRFLTNDSCSYGAADYPARTIQSLSFDKTAGRLTAQVVLHQDADSYTVPTALSGYRFIATGSTCSWTRYAPDGNLWSWSAPDLSAYPAARFSDVPADAWYADYVDYVAENGLMVGIADRRFDPAGTVTLAQAVTMAARIHSLYSTGEENFDQSTGSVWYQTYVDYARKHRIIDSSAARQDLNVTATRAQFAGIFAKSLPAGGLKAVNSVPDNSIPDVSMQESYAASVYTLYRAGVLTGNDEIGTFAPLSSITRAEAAAIVTRMMDPDQRQTVSLAPALTDREALTLALDFAIGELETDSTEVDRSSAAVLDSGRSTLVAGVDIFDDVSGSFHALFWIHRYTGEIRFAGLIEIDYIPGMVDLEQGEWNDSFFE